MQKLTLIESLQLEPHVEGGYFRRTYTSQQTLPSIEDRPIASSIFYMLTDDSSIGLLHRNQSDILHIWQGGDSLDYLLIDLDGNYKRIRLGPNLNEGEQLQLLVPGGFWKATELVSGEYGLLSEVVIPSFQYNDMRLATNTQMQCDFPELWLRLGSTLEKFCKK